MICFVYLILHGAIWLALQEYRSFQVKLWCAAGIGPSQIVVNEWAVAAGGHTRTGMEDNVRLDRDRLFSRNPVDGRLDLASIRGIATAGRRIIGAAQLNNIPFDAVNLTTAQSVSFSKKQDEIGYDWKQYDQTAERYTMVPNRVYLIKTTDAIIKMKFVDFYNDQGIKGHPKMAWEILK
jgi:hypothetical protein